MGMTMGLPADAPRGARRRLGCVARAAAIAVVTVAAVEIGTWLLFQPLAGVPFVPADLARARRDRLAVIDGRLGGADGVEDGSGGGPAGTSAADGAPGGERAEADGTPARAAVNGAGGATGGGLYDFHPYVGFAGRPGARPWAGEPTGFNAFGLLSVPGHAYPYAREPGDYVIAVLGGSVAEIFANTMEADLGAALAEADPAFRGRRVVMLSLALGGYKQPQQLFMLESLLLEGFAFDLVLNVDGFNDLALAVDNAAHGIHPLYPSGSHAAQMAAALGTRADPRAIRAMAAVLDAYARERRVLRLVEAVPLRHSVFLNAFGARYAQLSAARIGRMQAELAEAAQAGLPPAFRGPPGPVGDTAVDAAVAAWRDASAMIDAVCRDRGVSYVHVLQPNQYLEGSKPLSAREQAVAIEAGHPWGVAARRHYGRLRAAGTELRARGVAFHDLTQVFAGVTDDLYVDNCCHFNSAGNQILARAIAPAIAAKVRAAGGGAP